MTVKVLAAGALLVTLSACASITRTPPPAESYRAAVVPGFEGVRLWADAPPANSDTETEVESVLAQVFERAEATGEPPKLTLLAISGGSADGAYGAGLINGWTAGGDRPVFDVVTGVSTGSLIAPFAFLGSEYDAKLKEVFTETSTDDVAELALFSAIFGSGLSLADASPLRERIGTFLTDDMIDAIAVENRKGRRLLVGTTNLDARRAMIWNMGKIAEVADADPSAYELFRDVLAASAAIPGAFQPRYFTVEVDGALYSEMHVDGGVANSVFVVPRWFRGAKLSDEVSTDIYVIQNNKVTPDYGPTDDSLVGIAGDAISELIRNQSAGDLLRIYAISKRRGFGFSLATVPTDFNAASDEGFDPVYMRALFDVGFDHGRTGAGWSNEPPNLPVLLKERIAKRAR